MIRKYLIKNTALLLILVTVFSVTFGCAFVQKDTAAQIQEGLDVKGIIPDDTVKSKLGVREGMETVAENSRFELLINRQTFEFALLDKHSNAIFSSNPEGWPENTLSKAGPYMPGAQIVVEYYKQGLTQGFMDSYNDALLKGQIKANTIPNGIRVEYLLGNPTSERYYAYIFRRDTLERAIASLSESEQKQVMSRYRLVDKHSSSAKDFQKAVEDYPGLTDYNEAYVLRAGLGDSALKILGRLLQKTGITVETIKNEEKLMGYNAEDKAEPCFYVPVEYTLSDCGLTATIRCDLLEYQQEFPITEIRLLPFFGAASSQEKGYMLIPDGSGALIEWSEVNKGNGYAQPVYGVDPSVESNQKAINVQPVYLPVFGMQRGDSGFLSIITEGAALGTIYADVYGPGSAYNRCYCGFRIKEKEYLSYGGSMTENGTYIFQPVATKTLCSVLYTPLDGNKTGYVEMAKLYRQYLLDETRRDAKVGAIPMYLELVGAIDVKRQILGFPTTKISPLTTFVEAREIVSSLQNGGVDLIRLRYTGWANGGLRNSVFTRSAPLEELGGKKEFSALLDDLNKRGILFYPDVEISKVYKDHWFDGFLARSDSAYSLLGRLVTSNRYYYSSGLLNLREAYIVSPEKQTEILTSFLKDSTSWNFSGISLKSAGTSLASNYSRSKTYTREETYRIIKEACQKYVENGGSLITDGCFGGLLPLISGVMNLPGKASMFPIETVSIPFYQMVVQGAWEYTLQPVNLADDYTENILRSAQTAAGLSFVWMYAEFDALQGAQWDDLYSSSYTMWKEKALALYNDYNSRLAPVAGVDIEDFWIDGDVHVTLFENQHKVMVNYGSTPYEKNGIYIPAKDFCVV